MLREFARLPVDAHFEMQTPLRAHVFVLQQALGSDKKWSVCWLCGWTDVTEILF
jgi:hypothetical protein